MKDKNGKNTREDTNTINTSDLRDGSKLDCEIVQDLFPNYIEDLCNAKTKAAVNQHLAECEGCRGDLEDYVGDIDEGPNENASYNDIGSKEEISKKIVAKIATKKIQTIAILVFLLFGTGVYRVFYEMGSRLSLTPESAFFKDWNISNNAEIIEKIRTDDEVFIIYQDGTYFGVARVTKYWGGFWHSGGSNSGELLIGSPFTVSRRLRNNDGIWNMFIAVKANDPYIQYVVFDKADILHEGDLKLNEAQTDDRFLLIEITDGYGYVLNFVKYSEYTSHYIEIGYFTKEGIYKSKNEYTPIRGEARD